MKGLTEAFINSPGQINEMEERQQSRVKTDLLGRVKCGQALSGTLFIFQVFQGQLLGKALNSSAPVPCFSRAVWKL